MSKMQERILIAFILIAFGLGISALLRETELIPIDQGNIQKSLDK